MAAPVFLFLATYGCNGLFGFGLLGSVVFGMSKISYMTPAFNLKLSPIIPEKPPPNKHVGTHFELVLLRNPLLV